MLWTNQTFNNRNLKNYLKKNNEIVKLFINSVYKNNNELESFETKESSDNFSYINEVLNPHYNLKPSDIFLVYSGSLIITN